MSSPCPHHLSSASPLGLLAGAIIVESLAALLAQLSLGHHLVDQLGLVDLQVRVTTSHPGIDDKLVGVEAHVI